MISKREIRKMETRLEKNKEVKKEAKKLDRYHWIKSKKEMNKVEIKLKNDRKELWEELEDDLVSEKYGAIDILSLNGWYSGQVSKLYKVGEFCSLEEKNSAFQKVADKFNEKVNK